MRVPKPRHSSKLHTQTAYVISFEKSSHIIILFPDNEALKHPAQVKALRKRPELICCNPSAVSNGNTWKAWMRTFENKPMQPMPMPQMIRESDDMYLSDPHLII